MRPQMTKRRTRIACWITKATNKHSEYVTFNSFFPLQQWLHERASMLRYKHVVCIVGICIGLASEILHCHALLYYAPSRITLSAAVIQSGLQCLYKETHNFQAGVN
jgi:hypothetical protein